MESNRGIIMRQLFKTLDTIQDLDLRLDILREIFVDLKQSDINKILNQYIKYEDRRFSTLLAEKNRLIKLANYEAVKEVKTELKNVKDYVKVLRKFPIYSNKEQKSGEGKTNASMKRLEHGCQLSTEKLLEYDKFCGTNFSSEIEKLSQNTLNISLLKDIKSQCIDSNRLLKKIGREAIEKQNLEQCEKISKLKKIRIAILDYVNNLISIYNVTKKKSEKREETYEDVFGKDEVLTKKQIHFIEAIMDNKEVEITNLFDYVIALREIIKHSSFLENENNITRAILKISELTPDVSSKEYYYNLIMDVLKNKRKRLGKEEKLEKYKIDELVKYLKDIVLYQDNVFVGESTILNYSVLEYCLNKEIPYYYLRRIVKDHSDAILFEKDGESLFVKILEKYIESQKIELRNHRRDYIHKEYYRNLYHLLLQYKEGEIPEITMDKLNMIASDFQEYLKLSGYKSENKNEALTLFEKFLNPCQTEEYLTYTKDDIFNVEENLKEYTPYLAESKSRVKFDREYLRKVRLMIENFQEEFYEKYEKYPNDSFVCDVLEIPYHDYMNAYYRLSTVSFEHDNITFSAYTDEKGATYFRMNVLDLTAYVNDSDILNTYLKENMGKNLKNNKRFAEDYLVPSVTYQLKVFPNGSVGNLKVFSSATKRDKKIITLDGYRGDDVTKKFVTLYKKISKSNVVPTTSLELERFFVDYMTDYVGSFCLKQQLPIILKGKKYKDLDVLMKIQNDLGPIFSEMESQQFNSYLNIFNEELDASHFVCSEYDEGNYSLKLVSPSSYVDLFNQRMLIK